MKIKHYFGLAVIAAMTASCSSNEDLGAAGPGTGTNETGVGYATFTINLPTTSGTRGTENDQFSEGTPSEYAVNDATLIIFEKEKTATSENEYKFVETVPLGNLEPWKKDNESNGITTEATITAKLKSAKVVDSSDKYYALVILNNEATTGNKVTVPTATTETYGTWNIATKVDATNLLDNKKGFYMANAPEFKKAGDEPTTLVPIKGIYRTKEEAQSKPGTTIHVERGLAKVTVGPSSEKDYFATAGANATGNKYKSDNVKIKSWALDVTNNSSFPVHVTSGLNDKATGYPDIWKNEPAAAGTKAATSRFVSQLNATGDFKRVYWGIDPNYSMDLSDLTKCKTQFTLAEANGTGVTWKDGSGSDNPLYCMENTFDIKNMLQGQTTRVLLKATYTPKDDTGNSLADADGTFYTIGNMPTILKEADLETTVNKAATSVLPGCVVDYDANLKKAGSHVITLEDIKENASSTTHLDGTTTYGTGSKKGTEIVKEINNKLGLKAGVGINTYLKGDTYYIARIKHFGDDLTPWAAGDETYGGKNLNWLGRYGVLRNNWYDLTVNSISGPGYPDVPEVKPDDPDDEDTKYINVSVKILDWAKRSQNVDL